MDGLFPAGAINDIDQIETSGDLAAWRINIQADPRNIGVFHRGQEGLTNAVIACHTTVWAQATQLLHQGPTYRDDSDAQHIVITRVATGFPPPVIVVSIPVIIHGKRGFDFTDTKPVHNGCHDDFSFARV